MFSWLYWENQSKVQMYNFLPLRDQNSDDLSINAPSFCFIEQTDTFSNNSVSNLKQTSLDWPPKLWIEVWTVSHFWGSSSRSQRFQQRKLQCFLATLCRNSKWYFGRQMAVKFWRIAHFCINADEIQNLERNQLLLKIIWNFFYVLKICSKINAQNVDHLLQKPISGLQKLRSLFNWPKTVILLFSSLTICSSGISRKGFPQVASFLLQFMEDSSRH